MGKIKSKFIITSLFSLSVLWIFYVTYEFVYKSENLIPERIFSDVDGRVLLVNRMNEIDFNQLEFNLKPAIVSLVENLRKEYYKNEKVYFSENRPLVLINHSVFWDKENIHSYFKLRGLKISNFSGKKFRLNDAFDVRFYGKNLIIYQNELSFSKNKKLENVDFLATASIIHFANEHTTNVYFKSDGIIDFKTSKNQVQTSQKVNDAELFANELPEGIENYHFVEKNQAIEKKIISKQSSLYQWMDEGFVTFDYLGSNCLMSDFNKIIEPVAIVNNLQNTTYKKGDKIELRKPLTSNFTEKNVYIDYVSDKIIVCENYDVISKIQLAFQLGKTLSLNLLDYQVIYKDLPQKTHERVVNQNYKYTETNYKNLLVKTEKRTFQSEETKTIASKEDFYSQGISSNVLEIVNVNNTQISFLNDQHVVAIGNQEKKWTTKLDSPLKFEPKELAFNVNEGKCILVHTKDKLHLLNERGDNMSGFPIAVNSISAPCFYTWNNLTSFVVINQKNELLQIDHKGVIKKKFELDFEIEGEEITVLRKYNKLIANIVTKDEILEFDLEANKIYKKFQKLDSKLIPFKKGSEIEYYFIKEDGLYSVDLNRTSKKVVSASFLKNLKVVQHNQSKYLLCNNAKSIFIVNENKQVNTILVNEFEIDNFDILFENQTISKIAVLDGVENKIRIINAQGKTLLDKKFNGKDKLKLIKINSKYFLTTSLQNNILQYKID